MEESNNTKRGRPQGSVTLTETTMDELQKLVGVDGIVTVGAKFLRELKANKQKQLNINT